MTDLLLQVLSMRGTMSLADFERAMDTLHARTYPVADDVRFVRRRVAARLDALGHCDVDFSTRRVACSPPSMALLPGTWPARAALCGARTSALIASVTDYSAQNRAEVAVTIRPQDYAGVPLPHVVIVESPRSGGLAACAAASGIMPPSSVPSAWEIGSVAGGLADYLTTVERREFHPPNWPCRTFEPRDLQFARGERTQAVPRLVEYTSPVDQDRRYFWVTGREALVVDRSWGRFLALQNAGARVLLYDSQQQLLGVPVSTALPRLLARAATLCSATTALTSASPVGAAAVPRGRTIDVFSGVPDCLASLVAQKAGQAEFVRCKFPSGFLEAQHA